ncbi:MAG: flippase-like domain-containing protein [Ktedonobacterales bacterium]|nr:flippase-like domain-containing protein [Ktedonobacterales bacterium]
MVKKLLNPKVIIFVVLGVSVIAALLAFGDIRRVLRLMASFPRIFLLWYFLLMVAYEVVRGVQWHLLLKALDIRVPLRIQIFAYLSSEVAKAVPIGNYFENYILERAEGTDVGRSSAATTLSVLIEVGTSLVDLVLIGLGSWSGWLRPVIVLGTLAFGLGAWGVHRFHRARGLPRWILEHRLARTAAEELRRFREGVIDLLHPRVLATAIALGTVYLLLGGSALYLVIHGLGLHVSLWQAWAVYFFSLAFSLIFPLPVDIGVLEVSATGALLAEGVSRTPAVGVVLINRVLSLASSLLIAVIGLAYLHEGFHQVLRKKLPTGAPRPQPPVDRAPNVSMRNVSVRNAHMRKRDMRAPKSRQRKMPR